MISGSNAANAQDLQHAQQQLQMAQQRGDQKRIQSWQNRVNSINNGTFDRSKIQPARPFNDKQVVQTTNNAIGGALTSGQFKPLDVGMADDPETRQRYVDTAFKSLTKNFDADYGRKRQELEDRLVNSGNAVGSPLYNKQMELLNRDEADARAAAQNQAQMTGADYLTQGISNRIGLSGANNQTLGTLGGLKQGYDQTRLGSRELDLAFQKLRGRGGGAAPAQPESPFMSTLPPGFSG